MKEPFDFSRVDRIKRAFGLRAYQHVYYLMDVTRQGVHLWKTGVTHPGAYQMALIELLEDLAKEAEARKLTPGAFWQLLKVTNVGPQDFNKCGVGSYRYKLRALIEKTPTVSD